MLSRSSIAALVRAKSFVLPARAGVGGMPARLGWGPPPLETRAGWLLLYHGVRQTASGALYRAGRPSSISTTPLG